MFYDDYSNIRKLILECCRRGVLLEDGTPCPMHTDGRGGGMYFTLPGDDRAYYCTPRWEGNTHACLQILDIDGWGVTYTMPHVWYDDVAADATAWLRAVAHLYTAFTRDTGIVAGQHREIEVGPCPGLAVK